MDMFESYINEREEKFLFKTEDGFVKYSLDLKNGIVYVEDIYVIPERRRSRIASEMCDSVVMIAKGMGCTKLFGSVVPTLKAAQTSLLALLGYGMHLHSVGPNIIYFMKEI